MNLFNSDCRNSFLGHRWKSHRNLNSGFWHDGALARTGEMCEHCIVIRFPETDEQFFNNLPHWLKKELVLGRGYVPKDFVFPVEFIELVRRELKTKSQSDPTY